MFRFRERYKIFKSTFLKIKKRNHTAFDIGKNPNYALHVSFRLWSVDKERQE